MHYIFLHYLFNSFCLKRVNEKIEYCETGRYVINDVSERYYYKYFEEQQGDFVKITHLTSYQICDVFTNRNTPISAYISLNGAKAQYKVVFDHNGVRLLGEEALAVLNIVETNLFYNCHGLTFLDKMFWFELNNETCQIILEDDEYKECRLSQLRENGIALYYLPSGELYHSARVIDGKLVSKFGINNLLTYGEDHIKRLYRKLDFSQSRYFNP